MYFWCLQFSQKMNKNNSTWGTIEVKLIFFVRFLGELKIPKRHFKINWPLAFLLTNAILIFPRLTLKRYRKTTPLLLYQTFGLSSRRVVIYCQNLHIGFSFLSVKRQEMVFCYQNCSDLLWEKIVLVIEKKFWNSRLKPENLQKIWDH